MPNAKQLINNGANIVSTVKSFSRNGKTRKMCIYACYENKLFNLNNEISSLLGLKLDKYGYLIIHNCGQSTYFSMLSDFLSKLGKTSDEIEKIYYQSQVI